MFLTAGLITDRISRGGLHALIAGSNVSTVSNANEASETRNLQVMLGAFF